MLTYLIIVAKVFGLMLFADFLTGLVHFWMDQYGREDMPFVGKHVIEINVLHHSDPRHMVKKSYFQLTWTSWVLGLILGFIGWTLNLYFFEILFVVAYAGNANIIHKWTHQTEFENGKIITFLQKMRLIQSAKHHREHHAAPYDKHYCILTDWLNPVLHKIYFWEGIVFFFRKLGVNPIAGSQIRKFV